MNQAFNIHNHQRGTSMDNRTAYIESLSAQMVEWDLKIKTLKDRVESSVSGTKPGYAGTIAALQLKRDEAASICCLFPMTNPLLN